MNNVIHVYNMCTSSTTFVLAVSCIGIFVAYDYWKKLYFKRNGIPGPIPLPIAGTLFSGMKGFTDDWIAKQKRYGKVYGINLLGNVLVISDVEILQEIMISKFSLFPNRGKLPLKDAPMHRGLSAARDEQWRTVRNTVTPAFSGNKMKLMADTINESCDQLIKSFESHRNNDRGVQCKDLFGAYSMDVVAAVFFGLKVDSQQNREDPFVRNAKQVFTDFSIFSPKVLAAFFLPGAAKVMNFFNISQTEPTIKKFFFDVISHTLELRKTSENMRTDVLQLMANAHHLDLEDDDGKNEIGGSQSDEPPKKALTTEEIMANAMIFFFAGYETTNTALCFTSFLLATNPELQEKLIQEVDEFVPTRDDLSYEVLSKMEYLDCFVKESLRVYPPVAILDRDNDKGDITIKDLTIPKGVRIFVPIYVIHHDPDLWEEPEEFRPERFNKENRGRIHPLSWIPFGDGPRNCIGMRLAMMEIKFAIVRLLREFRLETCSQTEIPPVLNTKNAFTGPPNGIKLNVVPRKKSRLDEVALLCYIDDTLRLPWPRVPNTTCPHIAHERQKATQDPSRRASGCLSQDIGGSRST